MPMWFRGPDMKLRLVNSAYVEAVGAESAEAVVEKQIELIERGRRPCRRRRSPRRRATRTCRSNASSQATVGSQRRTLRVSDLPLGEEGVAGYAIDIEEMEEQSRAFRAFREAQRADARPAFDRRRAVRQRPTAVVRQPAVPAAVRAARRCHAWIRSASTASSTVRATPAACPKCATSPPGGASLASGSPPMRRTKRPGR